MEAKLRRTDIGKQILTSIGNNHLETVVVDGFYVEGPPHYSLEPFYMIKRNIPPLL